MCAVVCADNTFGSNTFSSCDLFYIRYGSKVLLAQSKPQLGNAGL